MTFGNPLGLIGLLSLPVILFLHLLRERQRRYVVSDLSLWSFLNLETRGPRTRRIPLTWLLLLDLLIAAFISLAWAQPRLAADLPVLNAHHLVVLLDVSSSMRAEDGPSSRFFQAQTGAAALLDGLNSRDVVTILAFGRGARQVADSRMDDVNGLLAQIEALQAGETGHALSEALALGQVSLDGSLPAEFHILTDGAFPLEDPAGIEAFARREGQSLHWHLVGQSLDNQAVLALNATPLGENRLQVFTRIANFGRGAAIRELLLNVDGETVERAIVELPADSAVPQVWQITVTEPLEAEALTVSLLGDDRLAADDSAAVALQPGNNPRVALVAENPVPLQQAVQAIPGTELQIIRPEEYTAGLGEGQPPFDLTIFRDFIPESWPDGQVLVVEPPTVGGPRETSLAPSDRSLYAISREDVPANATLQIPAPDPLVSGIDFSGVRWSKAWTLERPPPGFLPLLRAGDVPLLLRGEIGVAPARSSRVVVLLADLNQGNFTKHPAFPILMANLVLNARQAPLPASFKTGEPLPLPDLGDYQAVRITPPGQAAVELGADWPSAWGLTLDPGLYRLQFVEPGGEALEFVSGANAGDETESDLRPRDWTRSALVAGRPAPGESAAGSVQAPQTVELWTWLLAAVILGLLLEAFLAWKR